MHIGQGLEDYFYVNNGETAENRLILPHKEGSEAVIAMTKLVFLRSAGSEKTLACHMKLAESGHVKSIRAIEKKCESYWFNSCIRWLCRGSGSNGCP